MNYWEETPEDRAFVNEEFFEDDDASTHRSLDNWNLISDDPQNSVDATAAAAAAAAATAGAE